MVDQRWALDRVPRQGIIFASTGDGVPKHSLVQELSRHLGATSYFKTSRLPLSRSMIGGHACLLAALCNFLRGNELLSSQKRTYRRGKNLSIMELLSLIAFAATAVALALQTVFGRLP
jgi:hypothetical protein